MPAAPRADSAPLPPIWRIDPPAPAAPPAPHVVLPEPPPAPRFEAPPPPPVAPKPAAPAPLPKPVAKAPPPAPAPAPKPAAVPAPKAVAPAPKPAAPPPPLPLLPLVALNAVFDAACGAFGPPGRLLRSGFFKQLYGLAGLGLLAYTAAHVAQVQGLIALPIDLPWPR
jgi:hypothetical protein